MSCLPLIYECELALDAVPRNELGGGGLTGQVATVGRTGHLQPADAHQAAVGGRMTFLILTSLQLNPCVKVK